MAAEKAGTPLEVAAHPALWRQVFQTQDAPRPSQVKKFVRTELAPDAALYSAELGARMLVVAFCGKGQRLLMPIPVALQSLDDRQLDILVLADRQRLHFDQGVEGLANSFLDLAVRIQTLAAVRKYERIVTYGVCMGGFPALRMGNLLGAQRAISIAGRQVWHPARLKAGDVIGAFDPICNCRMPAETPSFALFSDRIPAGVDAAKGIGAIMGTCDLIGIPCDKGNFPFQIYLAGRLDAYHDEIFDLAHDPDPVRLAGLLKPQGTSGPLPAPGVGVA